MELTSLKPKHKDLLEANGPLPKPELDPEIPELLDKTDSEISSDDLANASLDTNGEKPLVYQLASLALHQVM
jgi:hypothetical protein